jgi:hypothetical protein
MSRLARALYGFPPGTIVTKQMMEDRKACLEADPLYSSETIRSFRGRGPDMRIESIGEIEALATMAPIHDRSKP